MTPLPAETYWIDSGDHQLFGLLHRADNPQGTVLICHGFTGSHIGPKYAFVDLARKLCADGYNAFRFDYAGSGNSEGDFTDQTLETAIRDARNAVEYLEDDIDTNQLGVVGHSMGGSVALHLADQTGVDVAVTWSTVADYRETFSSVEQERIQSQDTVRLFGFDYPTKHLKQFLMRDIPAVVERLDIPLLIAHGENDYTVPVKQAEQLYDAATDPRKLVTYEDTGHDWLHPEKRNELIAETVDWFNTYL